MSYATNTILKDSSGNPIPQEFDKRGDRYLPYNISRITNAIQNGQKSLSTTPKVLCASSSTPLANRFRMHVFNNSTAAFYVGSSGVGVDNGYPLSEGREKVWEFNPSSTADFKLYAIAASSNVTARILEEA